MKAGFIFAAGIALLGIVASAEAAATISNQEPQKKALERLEQRWLQNENNPEVLQDILGDDFVHVLPTGMISKSEQLAYLRRSKAATEPAEKHFEVLKIRIYGETGIVNGVVRRKDSHGKAERRTAFTDVFVLRGGKWQAVNAQETLLGARE